MILMLHPPDAYTLWTACRACPPCGRAYTVTVFADILPDVIFPITLMLVRSASCRYKCCITIRSDCAPKNMTSSKDVYARAGVAVAQSMPGSTHT